MDTKTARSTGRIIHLVGAVAIGVFVYSPWGANEVFRLAMQAVVIPVLALTGLALWKQARVTRFFRLRRESRSKGFERAGRGI